MEHNPNGTLGADPRGDGVIKGKLIKADMGCATCVDVLDHLEWILVDEDPDSLAREVLLLSRRALG